MGIRTLTLALAFAAGTASASNLLSFAFSDLNGAVRLGSRTPVFTADWSDQLDLVTNGDVSRLVGSGGTALFDASLDSALANLSIRIDVLNITPDGADGTGVFSIIDADGDALTGTIAGEWNVLAGTLLFFHGEITGATIAPSDGVNDATFDGSAGGSFPSPIRTDGLTGGLTLILNPLVSSPLTTGFEGASTEAGGILVPGAGTLLLPGLVGLAASRRSR